MQDRTRTILLPSPIERFKSRKALLEISAGPDKGSRFEVTGLITRIGSGEDNDLVLKDWTVSQNHFRIELDPFGYRIRDLDSKNGVRLGDLRVMDAYLPQSCKIQVGESVIRFRLTKEEQEQELAQANRLGVLVGRSLVMRRLFALVQRVAPAPSTVLLEGESGTGKEMVARTLHALSDRAGTLLETFDCTAVPASLMESHLFGHVKGAFTGAETDRAGALKQAHRGTLFIDEIGELPLELQGKLLRAIDRKEFRPLGAESWESSDVRVIAATNRRLEQEVAEGRFRQDLYYRLAVVRLRVPPLRERQEDIPLLVEDLQEELGASSLGRRVSLERIQEWQGQSWPGNVRELRNAVERTILFGEENELGLEPSPISTEGERFWLVAEGEIVPYKTAKEQLLGGFERRYWEDLLDRADWNVTKAASMGGIHRKSLEYLMKKLSLEKKSAKIC